jgi:hypothetical protein
MFGAGFCEFLLNLPDFWNPEGMQIMLAFQFEDTRMLWQEIPADSQYYHAFLPVYTKSILKSVTRKIMKFVDQ